MIKNAEGTTFGVKQVFKTWGTLQGVGFDFPALRKNIANSFLSSQNSLLKNSIVPF